MKFRSLFSFLAPLSLVASLAAAATPPYVPVGGEIRVNTTTADNQSDPDAAVDDAGNFVVVWATGPFFGNTEIFAQRYNANGIPLGSELRSTPSPAPRRATRG